MDQKDYYQILAIERTATQQDVKEAYRKLALKYHPDRNQGDPGALEKMKELNEAYAVLSDPGKRREYNFLREQYGSSAYDRYRQSHSQEDIFQGSDINQIFEEMARSFGLRGFEDIFRGSFEGGHRTFEIKRPGVFGRGFVIFGPGFGHKEREGESATTGIAQGILGKVFSYMLKKIFVAEVPKGRKEWEDSLTIDPQLAATGGKVLYVDPMGSREIMISVPPGTRQGQKIRLKSVLPPAYGNGESPDLYLKVHIRMPLAKRIAGLLRRPS